MCHVDPGGVLVNVQVLSFFNLDTSTISVMAWPLYPWDRDQVFVVQNAGGPPGMVWTDTENRALSRVQIPNRPACSKLLYQLLVGRIGAVNGYHMMFCIGCSILKYTGLFISPSGISELNCATTKTDTA